MISDNESVVIVTGDRKWEDIETVFNVISKYPPTTVFVHGYADGLDCTVDVVANDLGFRVIRCPSHWRHNAKRWVEVYGNCHIDCVEVEGKAAGVIRNKFMLDTYLPFTKEVIGFHNDILKSKGTKDMLKRSQKAGLNTILYTSLGEAINNPRLTKIRQSSKLKQSPVERFFSWG